MKDDNKNNEIEQCAIPVIRHNAYILIRDVTKKECDWLSRTFKKGEIVYKYSGPTYGCISWHGTAFTLVEGETPFFELPNNAVVHCGLHSIYEYFKMKTNENNENKI